MGLYRYVKATQSTRNRERKFFRVPPKPLKVISGMLLTAGIIVVANVLWPLISYELFTAPQLAEAELLSPVPVSATNVETNEVSDLTQPQNWFPQTQYAQEALPRIRYTLSIPKFNIKDARVEVGGDDLKKSLVQFPGTALPGKVGAPVIFGHSILPQFFRPDNYLSIFSLLPTLQFGDEIIIKFDGITYTYRVVDKVEVKPTNLSVLDQPYNNEYLRLITCTPPGTYLRRGVITAVLVD